MATTAFGVLEVRGMVALAAAVDVMFKAADVRLAGRHMIGSGWLTVVIDGATGDVETAMEAGNAEAARHGEVITAVVLPRPEIEALASMPHTSSNVETTSNDDLALGILETKGFVPLVAGVDSMVKAGVVDLVGWTFIGGALVHAFVRGTVGDVEAALAAGENAARRAGEFHAALVLSQPEAQVLALAPPAPTGERRSAGAVGVVETTGYAGAVAATDGMSKQGDVDIVRLSIGSGGRVAAIATGRLDEVRSAVDAGAESAAAAAELNGKLVVSSPDETVMAAFAHAELTQAPRPKAEQALGLLETRSTIGLVKALDAMLKNADVTYEGRHKVGYFLTACVVRGEVGAVETALDIGRQEAARHGELVAAHAIPLPYDTIQQRLPHA